MTSPEQRIAALAPQEGSVDGLIEEIERYLAAVALFRSLGCEPSWRCDEGSTGRVVELIAPYVGHVGPV